MSIGQLVLEKWSKMYNKQKHFSTLFVWNTVYIYIYIYIVSYRWSLPLLTLQNMICSLDFPCTSPMQHTYTKCRPPMKILLMFGLLLTTCTGTCWLSMRTSVSSLGKLRFQSPIYIIWKRMFAFWSTSQYLQQAYSISIVIDIGWMVHVYLCSCKCTPVWHCSILQVKMLVCRKMCLSRQITLNEKNCGRKQTLSVIWWQQWRRWHLFHALCPWWVLTLQSVVLW